MDAELVAYMDRRFDEAQARFAADLAAGLAASEERLRRDISADTARHVDVVVESFTSKLDLVVEGIRTVDQRVTRFNDEVRGELEKVDRRLLYLQAQISRRRRRRRRP